MMESWEYADPLFVAIRREAIRTRRARTCEKCIHSVTVKMKNETHHVCDKNRRYGRVCNLYIDKSGDQ